MRILLSVCESQFILRAGSGFADSISTPLPWRPPRPPRPTAAHRGRSGKRPEPAAPPDVSPKTANRNFLENRAMDWNRIEGNWKQTKGKIKEKWGQLTEDDLTQVNGKRDQLEGMIQERYGIAKDRARKDIDDWLKSLN
jgi:uncharacterized protein YjbJ (UPF0337 family)